MTEFGGLVTEDQLADAAKQQQASLRRNTIAKYADLAYADALDLTGIEKDLHAANKEASIDGVEPFWDALDLAASRLQERSHPAVLEAGDAPDSVTGFIRHAGRQGLRFRGLAEVRQATDNAAGELALGLIEVFVGIRSKIEDRHIEENLVAERYSALHSLLKRHGAEITHAPKTGAMMELSDKLTDEVQHILPGCHELVSSGGKEQPRKFSVVDELLPGIRDAQVMLLHREKIEHEVTKTPVGIPYVDVLVGFPGNISRDLDTGKISLSSGPLVAPIVRERITHPRDGVDPRVDSRLRGGQEVDGQVDQWRKLAKEAQEDASSEGFAGMEYSEIEQALKDKARRLRDGRVSEAAGEIRHILQRQQKVVDALQGLQFLDGECEVDVTSVEKARFAQT